jgi:hypothetical protein
MFKSGIDWWARIERKLGEMKGRECWRPLWNLHETGDLVKIDVNFQEAQRKLKQAAARLNG